MQSPTLAPAPVPVQPYQQQRQQQHFNYTYPTVPLASATTTTSLYPNHAFQAVTPDYRAYQPSLPSPQQPLRHASGIRQLRELGLTQFDDNFLNRKLDEHNGDVNAVANRLLVSSTMP